jgi:FtsP/CotA-like multicopper oxidase with cupredoxin domain/plastocyanin
MAVVVHYWIQIENRRWDLSPNNCDRMTGRDMQQVENYTPTKETLKSYAKDSRDREVWMYNPIHEQQGEQKVAVDALILRRYKPPTKEDASDAWTVPDDRKINPWDINEPDPGEQGTMGTIPGPTLEMSVGDSMVVHFRNRDERSDWDEAARTHSLHPHGVVFRAAFDGAYPLSPPDPDQPIEPAERGAWDRAGAKSPFKQGDRVPPGGTFIYHWGTESWPTTAGVWLYHDHSINDHDNVELGAIGMIIIHNRADIQDVDMRLPTAADPTAADPTAFDPALLPGGSPTGSPIVKTPARLERPMPIAPGDLARVRGEMAMDAPTRRPGCQPAADETTTVTPAPIDPGRAIELGSGTAELDPSLSRIERLEMRTYRIPPKRQVIMQLYHSLKGAPFCINGRRYLGNTPTVLAGVDTVMRFGLVGMGSMFHTFHLHGHRWILPGPHGSEPTAQQFSPMDTPVSQFEDTRTFGPANSFVFTISGQSGSFMRAGGPMPEQALGEWHMHCHVLDHMMQGMMGSLLIVRGGEPADPLPVGQPAGKKTTPVTPGGSTTNEVHLTADVPPRFRPNKTTVKVGDTVTWIWDVTELHTVTADDDSWGTPKMQSSGRFVHQFTEAGEFPYYCGFHGEPGGEPGPNNMAGKIVVKAATDTTDSTGMTM